ncbi:MAG: GHKL domain-containing protein [Terrisporobacter sp.]|uniref:sensor histidine kinase n=1 Tax=Terrisporobacter sp. TaxID=1965305 RepID=UPI002FC62907
MLNIKFYIAREIIDSLVFVVAFFIMMKQIGYVYNPKNIFLKIVNLLLVLLIIMVQIKYYVFGIDIILLVVLLFLICKIPYEFTLKKAFVYSVLYTLIYKGVEFTFKYILLYFFILTKDKLNIEWNIYFDIFQNTISNVAIFSIVFSFDKLKKLSINKKYYLYIGFTIIINMLIILFLKKASNSIYDLYSIVTDNKIPYNQSVKIMPFVNFADLALPYIIVASNIVFIFELIKLLKSTHEKAKYEVINEKLDMQYNYYLNIKQSQDKVKRLYHDINNHMTNIKVIQNKNDEVDKYINSINEELKDFENTYNTGNVILDIILSEKSKLCQAKNIDFLCNIDFSKGDFIDMIDVSSIFSNLLDNAIEACDKIENEDDKKYINIRGTIVKSYYVIKCENSKTNQVVSKNNKIITSKKNKYLHGIGLESIKSSLKKYDGELDIQIEENKFISTIYIPIK